MGPVLAVCDACVLSPAPLRDLPLHPAGVGQVRPRWTDQIHEGWTLNLPANRPDLARDHLERTRALMERAVPEARVRGYEARIEALALPDADDRHVPAAAIEAGAGVIVTSNLADFPAAATAPHGVAAVHPDHFAVGLLDAEREAAWAAVRDQRPLLKNPPVTAVRLLETLHHHGLIRTTARLESAVDRSGRRRGPPRGNRPLDRGTIWGVILAVVIARTGRWCQHCWQKMSMGTRPPGHPTASTGTTPGRNAVIGGTTGLGIAILR